MTEREEIEKAMATLDQLRTVLGDAAVEAALAGLQQKLALLDKDESESPALTGERRVVTVLFCDVKGSTAMAEKLDPEEWAGIMKRAFTYLIPPVTRHEGIVARLMGDALLAFFGAPTTHEDDPQRGVRAGLEIVEGISIYREQLQRERGLDFNVRVGINTGLVFVGAIGADRRVEYTAVGDTMNLAARMEQTAQPGTVQISEKTFKLVQPWFEFEALGGIQVKGKSEPIIAYRVLGVKATLGRTRGLERQGLISPLVGRENEFQAIKVCVEHLSNQGKGGIVSIIGEAGLGKSRLITEVKSFAASNNMNVLWLEGQTLSFGQTISYWPFQQVLRAWAGITDNDDSDASWSKLENKVDAFFRDETIEYLPYLASLLALEVKGEYVERVKYLDGDAMGKQIFLTTRRFFERLARTQPTALVFEDLHWMDESSTNLLEHLLPLVEAVPLVIFGISRPERDTPAGRLRNLCAHDYSDRYTEILLAPLSDTDSAQLVHNLLEIEDLPKHLRGLILAKAEGNPFFLEEVIRTLIDARAVTYDVTSSRWRATMRIESVHIPDTIQGVILARVDRLSEEVKQVLRVASVIGRSFLYRVLKEISDAGQRLDNDLTELQHSELIREKQHLPELEYMFKHALAQEAMYESILLQKRRELHTHVAQVIESLFAERLEEFYGLLAYHYARGEVWNKAQEYLLKAADQSAKIAGNVEALSLYQQALKAYARAFGPRWDPIQRASLERKMGEALFRRGEHQSAMEYLERGLSYLGKSFPTNRWRVRLAILYELGRQVAYLLRKRFSLQPLSTSADPVLEEEFRLLESMGWIEAFANEERFLLITLYGLNEGEQAGFDYGIAETAMGLATAADMAGLFRLAGSYHQRAMSLAEKLRNPHLLGLAKMGYTFHEECLGEYGSSLQHGEDAERICKEIGDLHVWGYVVFMISTSLLFRSNLREALARALELQKVGEEGNDLALICWGLWVEGSAWRYVGQWKEAEAALRRARELAEKTQDYLIYQAARHELGQCYLRQGLLNEALVEQEELIKYHRERSTKSTVMLPLYNGLAEAYLSAAESQPHNEDWLKRAGLACQDVLRHGKVFRTQMPEALRLQGRYEWLCGKRKAARQLWDKSIREGEQMGMRYEVGTTHLEIGQRLGERVHLEKAERIFAEIGNVNTDGIITP